MLYVTFFLISFNHSKQNKTKDPSHLCFNIFEMFTSFISYYIYLIAWFSEKSPSFNAWLQSEVTRMDLPALALLPPFDTDSSMLELDGVHLKPASGLQFLSHLNL